MAGPCFLNHRSTLYDGEKTSKNIACVFLCDVGSVNIITLFLWIFIYPPCFAMMMMMMEI